MAAREESPPKIEFARTILVISTDYIITYHQRPLDVIDYVKEACAQSFLMHKLHMEDSESDKE